MEVVWNLVVGILNCRITASNTYHNFFHGFWAGCGTGTATVEAKLLQQLVAMTEEFLCMIFLDLQKVYDELDMYICLEIL